MRGEGLRARGSRDRGRKWLLCLCEGRLAEGQAGFCCGPDFLPIPFCLFTPCLSGFIEKLLLLCPLRKTKRENTSSIQSEDNAHKSIEEMSYQTGGDAPTMRDSFPQVF